MALTIAHLEQELARVAAGKSSNGYGYAYVETGRYKPYMPATLRAATKRGHRIERKGAAVFYVYPSEAMMSGCAQANSPQAG